MAATLEERVRRKKRNGVESQKLFQNKICRQRGKKVRWSRQRQDGNQECLESEGRAERGQEQASKEGKVRMQEAGESLTEPGPTGAAGQRPPPYCHHLNNKNAVWTPTPGLLVWCLPGSA